MSIHNHMETMHWIALSNTFKNMHLRFGIENVIVDNDQLISKLSLNERFYFLKMIHSNHYWEQ